MSKFTQKVKIPERNSGSITTGSAKTLIEQAKREVPGFTEHFAKKPLARFSELNLWRNCAKPYP